MKKKKEKQISCSHNGCMRVFCNAQQLKFHAMTHRIVQPYVCAVPKCKYSTPHLSKFQVHQRRHNGVLLYKCTSCTSGFTNRSDLVRHTRKHTGERKYKCSQCDYTTAWGATLKRHEVTHTAVGQQRRKRKEERLHQFLQTYVPPAEAVIDREVHVDFACALGTEVGQKFARIDFVYQRLADGAVFLIEMDEYSHSSEGYLLSCECRRMMDATTSLLMAQNKPLQQHQKQQTITWVRFNPDQFSVGGVKCRVPVKDRYTRLLTFLRTHRPSQVLEIVYFYYSCDDDNSPSILNMTDFPAALKPHCMLIM